MNSVAKIGLGITIVAGIGTGGYFITTSMLSKGDKNETPVTPKIPDANTQFTPLNAGSFTDDGVVGKIYYKYLVETNSHSDLWEGLHERYKEDLSSSNRPGGKFNDAAVTTGAFSTTTQTTLNKVCESAYKDKDAGEEDDNTKATRKGLWRYCSVYDPKFLTATNQENGNTIQDKSNGQLLSAEGEDNKELWNAKETDFFALTSAPSSKYFENLYTTKDQQVSRGKLKEKCKDAYSQEINGADESKPKLEDVLKFCSMKVIVNS